MKDDVVKGLAGIGGLAIAFVLISVIISTEEPAATIEAAPTPTVQTSTKWKQEYRDVYLEGCMQLNLATLSYCTCTLEYLEARASAAEVAQMGFDIENGYETPLLEEAIYECLELLN